VLNRSGLRYQSTLMMAALPAAKKRTFVDEPDCGSAEYEGD